MDKLLKVLISNCCVLLLIVCKFTEPTAVKQQVLEASEFIYHPGRGTFISNGYGYDNGVRVNYTAQEVLSIMLSKNNTQRKSDPISGHYLNDVNGRNETTIEPKRRFKRFAGLDISYDFRELKARDFTGNPIVKSQWQSCSSDAERCRISQTISHTITVSHSVTTSFGLDPPVLFVKVGSMFTYSRAVSEGKATTHGYDLASPSTGRLIFTPKLVEFSGLVTRDIRAFCASYIARAILTFGLSSDVPNNVNCSGPHEETQFFALNVPKVVEEGSDILDGVWSIEYKEDSGPVDDKNFHNIRDRDLPFKLDKTDFPSPTPKMCAQAAVARGAANVVVWNSGRCYVKKTDDGVGIMMDKFGKEIGNYDIAEGDNEQTKSQKILKDWIKHKKCDMIYHDPSGDYYCKKFDEIKDRVLMFRKKMDN